MTKSQKIRNLIAKYPDWTPAKLAEKSGASVVTVYSVMAKLRDEAAAVEVAYELKPPLDYAPKEVAFTPAAIDRQVGGNHYTALEIQPWEVIERNGMGFFDGNAVKYLMRYKAKGGVEDLKKAQHYLEKLIELEHGKHA